MVNSYMKIHEIINESCDAELSKFYKLPNKDFDQQYNPEAVSFAQKNHDYYDSYFKDWEKTGKIPVFDKPNPKNKQPPYTNIPKDPETGSAGYRGNRKSLKVADIID